jgi:AGCS family alanine or glycine:cation symporter
MEALKHVLNEVSGFVWGPVMLALLLGVGVYLTVGLRFMTWRRLGTAFRLLWRGRKPGEGEGDITPFQALMTALSATIGTGNIAGVATAIFLGGPGAVFWMWVTALFGMATKYAEAVLAVHYRETDEQGMHVGGPMYYIRNGLGAHWHWLGFLFAFFGMFAAFGIGNTVQSNSVADAVASTFELPTWVSGLIIAGLAGAVIIGGIRRIAEVAERLVPLMAAVYVAGALVVILVNMDQVTTALATILSGAFTGTAAAGGFAGAGVWAAIRFGVARGVFSNEAGLGSAPIAHAAAKTNDSVRQGTIGMLGTFIDTILICTMTALVIVITGAWTGGKNGAALSAAAYASGLPGFGSFIVTFGLIVFAFTTILGWSYYGERCAEFLFGVRAIWPYRVLWIVALPVGAMGNLGVIWLLADIMNGLMAVPNLVALAVLSPVVFRLTRESVAQ